MANRRGSDRWVVVALVPLFVALAVVLGPARPALAAGLAVDKTVSVNGHGTVTTAPTGEVLIALVSADGPISGGQAMTVSGAGLTWSLVRRSNGQLGVSEVWKATATTVLSGVTVRSAPAKTGFDQSLTVVTF